MKKILKCTMALALVLGMMLMLTGCDSWDYKKATKLYEKGQWDEAVVIFEELAMVEYEDSAAMVLACRYGKANQLYSEGAFEEALAIYQALGQYENSVSMIDASNYGWAGQLFEAGQYEQAQALYEALGTYEKSADQVKECQYQRGILAYQAKEYQTAAELLAPLGEYQDAQKYLDDNGWDSFVQYLAGKTEVVITNESPAYTVTVKMDGEKIRAEYQYGTEEDSTYLKFALVLEKGNPKAQLEGQAKYSFLGNGVADQASTAWEIGTYVKNGTITWDTYECETGGIGLAQYAGESLQRLTDGLSAAMAESGTPATIQNLGFKGL